MQINTISGGLYQTPYPLNQNANAHSNIKHNPKFDVFKQNYPHGITLAWNVNAYIEKKSNICERIKSICKRRSEEDQSQAIDPRMAFYQQPRINNQQTNSKSNIKQILNNVSGIVKPGQMCAIMGASGAGKTTLLNILNFRNRGKLVIKDDIRVNGHTAEWGEITKYSGYVQQLDLFIGTLTVREQLTLYAMLRIDKNISEKEKYERVDEVINQLNLVKCQDSKIGSGDLDRGISGGEKRRLAFACEVLSNPPLLYADEPTSGLDTFMAITIVDILCQLAKEGKTIVCTIHQPSSQIFEKFDTLCLLSEGRVAYFGPRTDAYNYFSRLGYRCPSTYNPADYYIQVLAIKPTMREQCLAKSKRICDAYQQSEFNQRVQSEIARSYHSRTPPIQDKTNWFNDYHSSYFTQLKWLLYREGKNTLRNPIATYILAGQSIVCVHHRNF